MDCFFGWAWCFGVLLVLPAPEMRVEGRVRPAKEIDYNRNIRPILSDACYACHGPDRSRRKAGFRLDRKEEALEELRSGKLAIVPGDRTRSELWKRLTATKKGVMPPRSSGKQLTPAQIELVGKWIDQGARWDAHWAYTPPQRPRLPTVTDRSWPRNAIDYFVLHRLEQEGLRPSPEADRATLIRRLSLDLTGLPPTPAEIDTFLADQRPGAYERLVDRLLASPHYGERMAQHWLDLARYADTNGYRLDNHRDVWLWREWVIRAYNRNMPFDQFTIEQLAGDLLPHATLDQKVATGFHRNTMVNYGNGSDPKEYLVKAVTDRAVTTATVWMGTTLGCAQCHNHKYDPFTQKDFYRLYAFFNNVPEKGLDGDEGNPVPSLSVPSPEQARKLADLRRQGAQKAEADLLRVIPSTLVMEEMAKPRVTRILLRGDYLDEGETVTPGVPAALPAMSSRLPANRLGLGRWLTDPGHPLTGRVAVNRLWQLHFGAGIVRTSDDFGAQGDPPSHPELLDWLATEFTARGWDVKAMQRLIVLSATYRQAPHLTEPLREKDPQNRLLARGARFRLDAEMIRDNALAVSGLLCGKIGGPSVRPYQPAGLWEQVAVGGNYTSQTYEQDKGDALYRRGIYTYWKRSLPFPSQSIFDAPNREACTVSRPRTNTPLQAMVVMNDPTFVEAGRVLAQRILQEGGGNLAARLKYAFRLCTARHPTPKELDILTRLYHQQWNNFRSDRQAAEDLVSVGESRRPAELDVTELAAWTTVASLLLNLDETITRG
jgi:hypothetical protein